MVQRKLTAYVRKRVDKLTKLLKQSLEGCGMRSGEGRLSIGSVTENVQQNGGRKIASRWFLIYILKTVLLISIYYVFSIGLTFYQKKFIRIFEFPLSIVTGHFLIKFFLAALVRAVWWMSSGTKRPCVSCQTFVTRIGPTGVAAALDIGMSNWSLMFITISLYTMTKSSAIVFILIFALLLRLEKFRWSLLCVVGLISSGLFLFTFESTQFHPFGFCLVLGASVLSGVRWTLSQCLTQRKDFGLSNPVDMIYHVQPWMFVTLLPLAIIFEGRTVLDAHSFYTRDETIRTFLLVLGGGVAGFLMEVSEYILLTHTSSITLSVAGITKEIFQFVLAYQYNGDRISPMNFVGLVVCMSGVVVHVVFKLIEQDKKLAFLENVTGSDAKNTIAAVALLSPDSSHSLDSNGEWDGLEEIDLSSASRNFS